MTTRRSGRRRRVEGGSKRVVRRPRKRTAVEREAPDAHQLADRSLISLFMDLAGELTSSAFGLAARTAGVPFRMAGALLLEPDQLRRLQPDQRKMMQETGLYLRDLREVAGLTLAELSAATDLKEHSLLEAVERGTATLSFELILRLAAVLARHDPIPFILRLIRTYNPEVWTILEQWGIARLPVQFERERQFLNVYRRHDAARKLSDEAFAEVLKFTGTALEMSLHFAAEHEVIEAKPARRSGVRVSK